MTEITTLSDFDIVFYYGSSDLKLEIESDVIMGLTQPKRSMFYNRAEGCGINTKENYPISVTLLIGLRYDIMNWITKRNTLVSDGQNGYPDRRVAASQSSIQMLRDDKGQLSLKIYYIPFFDYKKSNDATIPLMGG